jgi:hypothetical protein
MACQPPRNFIRKQNLLEPLFVPFHYAGVLRRYAGASRRCIASSHFVAGTRLMPPVTAYGVGAAFELLPQRRSPLSHWERVKRRFFSRPKINCRRGHCGVNPTVGTRLAAGRWRRSTPSARTSLIAAPAARCNLSVSGRSWRAIPRTDASYAVLRRLLSRVENHTI